MASSSPAYPIIDSHIHLFPSSELSTLSWNNPSHPLWSQHSLSEYRAAISSLPQLEGFIFLEVDRTHDLTTKDYTNPLKEVSFLKRIALGTPREGEGHTAEDSKLCLAIIPWAPLPNGAEELERYVDMVKEEAGDAWGKVRGFRYLVQRKPRGTMLEGKFIEGLKWMGRKGLVFDVGVDLRQGGKWQLEEAVQMIKLAHEGVKEEVEKVTFIINHLCKPDLTIYSTTDPKFLAWRSATFALASSSKTYLKLSGLFSEMPSSLLQSSVDDIVIALQPYLAVILASFGASRIMFGSDWPVCTVGIEGGGAWEKWRLVVERFVDLAGLTTEEAVMIWSGTAIRAYGIEELM